MSYDEQTYRLTGGSKFATFSLIIGVIGLAVSAFGYFTDSAQFFHSYLVAFFFWLSIGISGFFFTMLHHIVDAKWSVVIRRLSENVMMVVPVMALFAIPVIFGIHDLFHWSHPEAVAVDKLLQGKAAYLNTTFFIIRMVVYFAIWIIFAWLLYRLSIKQDSGHQPAYTTTFRRLSGFGIFLFALSITFASFDWIMSLDAHWYSTIFGVYIFAGAFLAFLSLLTFMVMQFNSMGILAKEISVEHYHDLGKLMFAFTIFWGYMAFSQYLLIWYGNIPEETVWFLHRWGGGWEYVTMLIVYGHFVVPFFGLFPMMVKRNRTYMRIIAVWILLMHWVDIYWMVMPNLHKHGVHLSWMDLTTMVGIGGVFFYILRKRIGAQPLIPVGDPGLKKSMEFVNQ